MFATTAGLTDTAALTGRLAFRIYLRSKKSNGLRKRIEERRGKDYLRCDEQLGQVLVLPNVNQKHLCQTRVAHRRGGLLSLHELTRRAALKYSQPSQVKVLVCQLLTPVKNGAILAGVGRIQ